MPAKLYPFIDIAVHERVREHFARGDAAVLFSTDMGRVHWSNGEGANLFGLASIYDFLDGGTDRNDPAFRQLEAAARQLTRTGDRRQFLMRIGSGFQKLPAHASVEMIGIRPGETAILFTAPRPGKPLAAGERAARMLSGFDDPDTHMAVLDGDGGVLAASGGFAGLGMTPQTCRALVAAVARDSDWLVKRPVPTGKGHLPAAIGKLSENPPLHLLFAVETILGNLDPGADFDTAEPESEDSTGVEAPRLDDGIDASDTPAEEIVQVLADVESETAMAQSEAVSGEAPSPEVVASDDDVQSAPTDDLFETEADSPTVFADEALPNGETEPESEDVTVEENLHRIDDIVATWSGAPGTHVGEGAQESAAALDDADGGDEPQIAKEPAAGTLAERPEGADITSEMSAEPTGEAAPWAKDDREIKADDGEAMAAAPAEASDEPRTADEPAVDTLAEVSEDANLSSEMSEELTDEAASRREHEDETKADEGEAVTAAPQAVDMPAVEVDAAQQEPAAEPFAFNPNGRAVRFVWKIDAFGRFSEISEDFATAVGPHSADVVGRSFADLAARYDLDPGQTIIDLLTRRDTWSGKTILWPVEGTSLRVPVDLAALPTYSRNREFDGFRGFGIVRVADAVEDENGAGLTLGTTAILGVTDDAHGAFASFGPDDHPDDGHSSWTPIDAPEMERERPVEPWVKEDDQQPEARGPVFRPDTDDETMSGQSETETGDPLSEDADDPSAVAEDLDDPFRGERPALMLMEAPARRASDKVVTLDTHRRQSSETLSRSEQAAFREIARQLGETIDQPNGDEIPAPEVETPPVEPDAANVDHDTREASAESDATPALQDAVNDNSLPDVVIGIAPVRSSEGARLTPELVNNLPVALLVHSGDALYHANPEFLSLTGYPSLALLEEEGGIDALFAGDDEGLFDMPDGTMMLIRHDGQMVPVTARLHSVRFEKNSALMMALAPVQAGAAQPEKASSTTATGDETESGEADIDALRVEAEELRSILETATDGVVVVGADGEIRSMNRSASALFNYDDGEIRGKPFAMLFAHESQRAVLDYLAGLSGHGVASVLNDGREVIGREASGGFIPLFMTMGRLSSSNGYCAVIRDITQWKRTEEELRNAKRAAETANAHKTDFLARVSHEIRTPLNAIIGFSDMMASEHFGPIGTPRYLEYASDIGRSGRHVLDIVNDLLDISKIEAGEMDLEFTAVELNDAVSEAVSLVQPQANSQRVIIRTSLSGAVPNVVADSRSIKQIALNILSNAIRFTPSGGQIVVSTAYEPNGSVILRIRDTGIGMTRSELEQAMKPFRQVTTGPRKHGDGTGLGLPLTKAMAEANRAQFSISSAPSEGTLVEISFPSQRVLAN